MAFAHTTRAQLSLVPPKRVQIHDAAGFASCCGPAGCAPPRGDRRSTSTPASRPTPGAPLPRTLASPRTGLTPAGCPELDARLHPNLLSCPDARTAGRTPHDPAGSDRAKWHGIRTYVLDSCLSKVRRGPQRAQRDSAAPRGGAGRCSRPVGGAGRTAVRGCLTGGG